MSQDYSTVFMTPEDYSRIHLNVSMLSIKKMSSQKSTLSAKLVNDNQQFTHKPEINKKSHNMQRSINDLFKWKENVEHKRRLILEREKQELDGNAAQSRNIQLSESRKSNKDVFARLCSPSSQKLKDMETPQQPISKKQPKPDSSPYYVKTMSVQQRETFESEQKHASQVVMSRLSMPQTTQFVPDMWKPCLPNSLYFNRPLQDMSSIKTAPVIDLRSELKQTTPTVQLVSAKRLSHQDTQNMVDRLNAWQAKKLYKLQSQQEINNQKEIDECTFKPTLFNNDQIIESPQRPSKEEQSYQNIFIKKIAKIPLDYR